MFDLIVILILEHIVSEGTRFWLCFILVLFSSEIDPLQFWNLP